ncbi:MAG: phage Gp37/Gp68 family protein [Elusimicrobium sp.]|jgi:protein gp37|nr:phage Gp37/Gp68 family protein [Elusimicrobium sp.]
MAGWNPWHGCVKLSAGCKNCYVYSIDAAHGKNGREIKKNSSFYLPVRRDRGRSYKLPPGETVYTCFTSDFFLEEADEWRKEAWSVIRARPDLHFFIITKRIDRFYVNLPQDWGGGYDNVTISCTVENQDRADYRLPIYKQLPIKHKLIICAPLLGFINLKPYLGPWLEEVSAGGESGKNARICDYRWVLDLRAQCAAADVPFKFYQTGSNFLKDGKIYRIPHRAQFAQAAKAGINYK